MALAVEKSPSGLEATVIRREVESGLWLFTQQNHAFLCGQLAQWWNSLLPHELILAAYIHDAGWQERDAAPQLNAYRQPCTFTELKLDDHFVVWRRSIDRVLGANRYAGLMVSLHASSLYERRLRGGVDSPENAAHIQAFIQQQRNFQSNLQNELIPTYGRLVENDALEQNLARLQAWDWLSLLLCMGSPRPPHQIKAGLPHTLSLEVTPEGVVLVSPWPFVVNEVTLQIEGRYLDQQTFEDEPQLQSRYDSTRLQPYTVRILPKE